MIGGRRLFPPFLHQEKFNPVTFCSQSSSVHKHCYAWGYSHPLVNEKRQGTTQSISQLHSSIITSRCFSCIGIPVRLKRTKPVFSPQPNNLYNRPRCFSLLLFFIDFHHHPPSHPQHFPPTPTHELFSSLSLSFPLLSSFYFSLSLFLSPHTYSWCSNSQSIRCPEHIKYGSTCNLACWKFIVLQTELWGVAVLPCRGNSGSSR